MISISPHNKELYKLNSSHTFKFNGAEITIPKGFVTDGASIPKAVWSIIGHPFMPRFVEAAVVHDFCVVNQFNGSARDKLFYETLISNGVKKWRAKAMYWAVIGWRRVAHPYD